MGLVFLLLAGLIVYVAALVAFTVNRLTRPPRRTYAWAVARSLPGDPGELTPARKFERFEFGPRGRHGGWVAWEVMGDDALGPVLILTHGWADSKVGALVRLNALAPCASRMYAWDLPGHGESAGTCALGLAEKEGLQALVRLALAGGRGVVLYGWSLGAGVSLAVGAEAEERSLPIAGVIAEAPYRLAATPARNVLRGRSMPWRLNLPVALWLIGLGRGGWKGFDRAEAAGRVRCPVLVLRGEEDEICPLEDSEAIAAAAPRGTLARISGAGHNDLWTKEPAREASTRAVAEFLRRVGQRGD